VEFITRSKEAYRDAERDAIQGYDLRLMSWGDGSGVPTSGSNLVIVGTDNNGLLHIRIFDHAGIKVTDQAETKLPTQAEAIQILKQRLPGLLPPHVLIDTEEAQLIGEATSIVGHTPWTIQVDIARKAYQKAYDAHHNAWRYGQSADQRAVEKASEACNEARAAYRQAKEDAGEGAEQPGCIDTIYVWIHLLGHFACVII
jgi:hypothetical protein